jgi:hypothetical protein
LGVIGPLVLNFIGSNIDFPRSFLWYLIGVAYFFERYGAMHLNLFSTSNQIINHIANGVAGAIYIVFAVAGYRLLGIYAFPLALIAGNLGFYCWFAARHSYKEFGISFVSFERTVMFPYLCLLVLFISVVSWIEIY